MLVKLMTHGANKLLHVLWFTQHRSQPQPVVPQGPYKNVFDIRYYNRDSRRRIMREEVNPVDPRKSELPPVPGRVPKVQYLGWAGDFDQIKD